MSEPNYPQMPSHEPLPAPRELLEQLPASTRQIEFIRQSRQAIIDILEGTSSRKLFVIGPCSIHDTTAAKDFAKKLRGLADRVAGRFQLVMRAYVEKPRTSLGWKGLLYDPDLDGSNDLLNGLRQSRQFLLDLADLELPAATEFLDLASPLYLGDLISWGSIGSRTTESQPHRQMVSGLCIPTGFKNGTDGNLEIAINALTVAKAHHGFFGLDDDGRISVVRSNGNPYCHMVLRGGNGQPNYDRLSVQRTLSLLIERDLRAKVLIDCSHDNSGKEPSRQKVVFGSIIDQILEGNSDIIGVILESYLLSGCQSIQEGVSSLNPGISVTDPCLDWEATEEIVLWAYDVLEAQAYSASPAEASLCPC